MKILRSNTPLLVAPLVCSNLLSTSRVKYVAHLSDTSPWLEVALGELGVCEVAGSEHTYRILEYHATTTLGDWGRSRDETAWCSSYVNFAVSHYTQGSDSALARSWLTWGVACEPELGCVCVIKRRRKGSDKRTGSRGGYHVGFYLNHSRGGVVLLSGNASDRVGIDTYSRQRYEVLAYRTA
jgi:uncharacterized protein (TIGR02594 family)